MRVLLLGKNGNLGRGIFQAFKQSSDYELIAPSKGELDLTDKLKTIEFVSKINPFVIINAASYTTNKNTSYQESIKIANTNLIVSDNLHLAAGGSNVNFYIDIGSASIYENFPNQVITEEDFRSITYFMPNLPYAKAKLIQTQNTIQQRNSNTHWISLILPYVISFDMAGFKETSGLFARISKQISGHNTGDNELRLSEDYDLAINRQFVHSIDVGNFCKYLLEDNSFFGVVHMPKLQQISIDDFVKKLNERLSRNTVKMYGHTSLKVKHPVLGSIWDDTTKFTYTFTLDRCVDLLQSKSFGK